ncbi:DUF551 domain-containing protein [Klebsiella grimontii]|uniref:DUF551 domain-containing protein n=1 Tax=Klebsiella grimontii TaxID=2058152 RepID=UPI001CCA37B8|nr:DUF551 domain-containing protein [Klebsiella grimontii]MBZ7340919.1 DUF551 domain-containing protein [Klebsiella grimontii]
MTTDITELAQREKFEAWFVNDVVGADVTFPTFEDGEYSEGEIYDEQLYFTLQAMWMAWKAAGAELVEALAAMDSEPVAWDYEWASCITCEGPQNFNRVIEREAPPEWAVEEGQARNIIPLYRHAQPAQTGVDDDVRNIIGLLETNEWAEHCTETVLGSRLEAEITRLVGSAQPAPVVPAEKTMPNPLSMYAVDAVAAIAEVKGWNACRATMLQAGNSPVIPEGYVMVPKEPTESMINTWLSEVANWRGHVAGYKAMPAAAPQPQNAPQNIPEIIPGWIQVSERMPEDRISVILWDAEIGEVTSGHYSHKTQTFYHCGDAIENEITHWMPPPCAPQEVKGEHQIRDEMDMGARITSHRFKV